MTAYFDEELLRPLLFRVLRGEKDWRTFGGVVEGVQTLARKENYFQSLLEKDPYDNYYEKENLRPEDQWTLHRLIWELIVQGIIVPGQNPGNAEWPNLSLTPYGKGVVKKTEPTPYEPDAYYRAAIESANEINPIVMMYLKESVEAFRRGLYLASAVMLGVASELVFQTLCVLISEKLKEAKEEQRNKKLSEARTVKAKHELLLKWIESEFLKTLPDSERLELHLQGVFSTIRLTRNQAGHPEGKDVDRQVALGHLTLFPQYLRTMAEYISLLKSGSIKA